MIWSARSRAVEGGRSSFWGATDIVKGRRFEFSQLQFEHLCSDLGALPLGRAVAASSIPPLLTNGVRLRNFPKDRCRRYIRETIEEIDEANEKVASNQSVTSYESALIRAQKRGLDPYLEQKIEVNAQGRQAYVHLADGGLADSLALNPIIEGLDDWRASWSLRRLMERKVKPEKIVIIVANMNTRITEQADYRLTGTETAHQIFPVLHLTSITQSIKALELARVNLESRLALLKQQAQPDGESTEFAEPIIVSSSDVRDSNGSPMP